MCCKTAETFDLFLIDLASVLQDYHYHAVIAQKHVLPNCAGYAEVKSELSMAGTSATITVL